MQKCCLMDDLYHIFVHSKCSCKCCCIIGNICGMAEGIMIFCINSCSQCVDGWFIFFVNMCMCFCVSIFIIVAEHGIKDLNSILPAVFYVVHRKINIFQQFFDILCRIRCCTDSRTDCDRLELHVGSAVIHNIYLFCNGFHQVSGREKVVA